MKLIFIYGPPAVGKLTVAEELSKITGYKIFHNHLVFDIISPIFDSDKKLFWNLIRKIKLQVIESAIKEKIGGLIFTMAWGLRPYNPNFINRVIRIVKKYKGKVYFVHLYWFL